MPDKLMEELNEFLKPIPESNDAINYAEMCFDKTTPSHKISIPGIYENIFSLYSKLKEKEQDQLTELVKQMKIMLENKGYRTNYLTPQEQRLKGIPYCSIINNTQPYTPTGILNGTLSIDKAKTARELAKIEIVKGKYFNENTSTMIYLEPLDETGKTIKDPQMLDNSLNILPTTYRPDFPFLRT